MYVLGPGLHRVALWAGKRLGCCEGISIERISGSEDAALLTNDAARAWIIEQKTGPGTWDAIEVLEQGATAVVGPSMRFYPEGMKEKTYEIAQGSSVENAEPTEASVPAAEGRRSAAVTIGGIGAVLDESDDDVYVVSVKRQRIEGSGTAGPGPSSEDQLRCPFSLVRTLQRYENREHRAFK